MRAFYGSRLSENMTLTPEGYLICLNVPIARTGTQEYLRCELGIADGDPNEILSVYRDESEVFSGATMASFEGKPVTEDHPPIWVTPENNAAYSCGHVQNIRRGSGEDIDLLIADLFITSSRLIEAIQNGLREVSCGYECEYTQDENGRIYQRSIRGNHVAVVPSGRAGSRVAIKDSDESKERGKHMKKSNNSLLGKLFGHAVKDMEPEEIADAIDEIQSAASSPDATQKGDNPDSVPDPTAKPKDEDPMTQLLAAINGLSSKLDQILMYKDAESEPAPKPKEPASAEADPLDSLVSEIKNSVDPADQEASTTVPAEAIHDDEPSPEAAADEDGPVAEAQTLPENPIPGADRAAALCAINAIRPIIAALPPNQRKAASDRAASEIRKLIGRGAPSSNGYSGIANIMRRTAGSKARDSKPDDGSLGRRIMESRNPHYMKSKS